MKKIIFFLFLFFLCSFQLMKAHESVNIKGFIYSQEEEGIDLFVENATVYLLNLQDSSVIQSSFTEKNGLFSFSKTPKNDYLVFP